jgi:phosphogluconate dehydratase
LAQRPVEIHPTLAAVTARIVARSAAERAEYLDKIERARRSGPQRAKLACGNLAHGFAACDAHEKKALAARERPNVAIVSSYNDRLSALQPFETYPAAIKRAAWAAGGIAQVAGGVPAMCDGITQGQPGMELSLFSRDVIALATAVALSHGMFDAALCLGVCDKIVPGLLIGALAFGHLPVLLVPAGPMPSGLGNKEKSAIRQLYAEGKIERAELLAAESKSYHSAGTCTFYGTANSNQLLMELMGLHLPGASFVAPGSPLRAALTQAAAERVVRLTALGRGESPGYTPLGRVVNEKAVVNGVVGLLASGGSTNHTIHLVAIARAAGITIDWDDFAELSAVVPLLARVYPNGTADVNHFHAAGGVQLMIRELLGAGLLHRDVLTVAGPGLERYTQEPYLDDGRLAWREGAAASLDREVLRGASDPFDASGGLKVLDGNVGRAIIKVSAVKPQHRVVEAPARVFADQDDVVAAFRAGELDRDVVVVVVHQGPRANGMPELHKLTPPLGVLQDRGFRVALVTDGRMSGASGKVPAAIQVTPEAQLGGAIGRIRDGDTVRLDAEAGTLEVLVAGDALAARSEQAPCAEAALPGFGRELFATFRRLAGTAERGASPLQ